MVSILPPSLPPSLPSQEVKYKGEDWESLEKVRLPLTLNLSQCMLELRDYQHVVELNDKLLKQNRGRPSHGWPHQHTSHRRGRERGRGRERDTGERGRLSERKGKRDREGERGRGGDKRREREGEKKK